MADEKKAPGEQGTIDFYTFVLSLGSSAFVHLGDAPHPETGAPMEPNFLLAQQTIDILAMLEQKTKGNLTPEEERLVENLLTDLRIRFVHKKSGRAD
ncbi:MAG TPA: DUF1844 domain-containing protein [Anaeromyxobacteraceae bacterium]|nr:DUF1844 domain-containing protein [Anaeromyxobacteraceae bacterium]